MGEQIGHVNTGLSEDSISKQLRTRSYLSSGTVINLEEAGCPEKEVDFCIICQVAYHFEMFSKCFFFPFWSLASLCPFSKCTYCYINPCGILDFTGLL